jgi:hypothetical protein
MKNPVMRIKGILGAWLLCGRQALEAARAHPAARAALRPPFRPRNTREVSGGRPHDGCHVMVEDWRGLAGASAIASDDDDNDDDGRDRAGPLSTSLLRWLALCCAGAGTLREGRASACLTFRSASISAPPKVAALGCAGCACPPHPPRRAERTP